MREFDVYGKRVIVVLFLASLLLVCLSIIVDNRHEANEWDVPEVIRAKGSVVRMDTSGWEIGDIMVEGGDGVWVRVTDMEVAGRDGCLVVVGDGMVVLVEGRKRLWR